MTVRVAINGFGRIGRQSLKALLEHKVPVEVVAINDLTDAAMNAHLFKHDSTYGVWPGTVDVSDGAMIVNGHAIQVLQEADPARLPWADLGVDIVLESTGRFREPGQPQAHLEAGARKVIVSAPARGADVTIVLGVNEHAYDPDRHDVISNASCTTNCLVPTVKVVHDLVTIERGLMNTVHSYTTSQQLLDMAHKDPRRARSAGLNIIPTTSGATTSLGQVMPELEGRFDGFALRVPTPTVSIVDVTLDVGRPTSAQELNDAFRAAGAGAMKGILGVSDAPLVSTDFRGDDRSAIVDAAMTRVSGGTLVKVLAWYDNEWGFSCRVADLIDLVAARLPAPLLAARA
jgi:glyceraldehyde 3-phosphate dehydrogenase